MLPAELIVVFAIIGLFAIAASTAWLIPILWYRIKHKKFPISHVELELRKEIEILNLNLEKNEQLLLEEKNRSDELDKDLKSTLEKLVSRV